ncbi:hypothetical protein IFR05_007948 [Cadophora sp. M221]|nr:hypothetical protein IFR05_007948 [Cadophora sp. M221]
MPNRLGKAWKNGSASKSAPPPSIVDAESSSSPILAAASYPSCLSKCMDAFRDSIFPRDQDLGKICAVISLESFFPLYCCDSRCGSLLLPPNGQDPNVNEVITFCKSFGVSVENPGPPKAEECSQEVGTGAWSMPKGVTTTSNNPPISAIQSSTSQEEFQSISVSEVQPPSLTLALSAASNTQNPARTAPSASTTCLTFNQISLTADRTSLTSQETSQTQMSSYPVSRNRVPHTKSSSHLFPSNVSANATTTSISPSIPPPTDAPQSCSSLWQNMSSEAQAGLIIGLCILALGLVVIILFLLDRHKRRHIPPSQLSTFNPETTVDGSGIRWPEKVTLQGDAKDFHSWTRQYEKEHRFRTSLREGQYRIETGKLGGSWVG